MLKFLYYYFEGIIYSWRNWNVIAVYVKEINDNKASYQIIPSEWRKNIEFIGPEFSGYQIILGLFIVANEEIGINWRNVTI